MNNNHQNVFGVAFLLAVGALFFLACGDDVKQPQKQVGENDPVTSVDSGAGDSGADTAADTAADATAE